MVPISDEIKLYTTTKYFLCTIHTTNHYLRLLILSLDNPLTARVNFFVSTARVIFFVYYIC